MDLHASGNGRRHERTPLDTLIELRSDGTDELLEADGLDLGPGGVSMRASFIPPLGARLSCQFRCPPEGDPVRAHGEVVWAQAVGPRSGEFGMRFLELDTKSATAIRRLLEPKQSATEPLAESPHLAIMRIDGLGVPIETDVRLCESDRIVLEQELSFLRLGRGVEIDVPGRGLARGRIASVELRHSPLDVPTLVFGVLLDEVCVPNGATPQGRPSKAGFGLPAAMPQHRAAEAVAFTAIDTWPERPTFADPPVAAAAELGRDSSALCAPAATPPETATRARRDVESRPEGRLAGRAAGARVVHSMGRVLATGRIVYRARLVPAAARARDAALAWLGQALPPLRRLLQQLGRFAALQWRRVHALGQVRARAKRRTTAPAPRAARTVHGGGRESERSGAGAAPRNGRMFAMALACVGVALGIYALAPRSGADRIPVRRSPPPPPQIAEDLLGPDSTAALAVPAPGAEPEHLARDMVAGPLLPATQLAVAPELDPPAPAGAPTPARSFGASSVPNGRTFAIRMSGPVASLEGDQREDGFTVRVPGRLALDRASPIATSHRAVARAMILNRGDYAELTVDFLPGLRPQYQVTAADNAIAVTLERL